MKKSKKIYLSGRKFALRKVLWYICGTSFLLILLTWLFLTSYASGGMSFNDISTIAGMASHPNWERLFITSFLLREHRCYLPKLNPFDEEIGKVLTKEKGNAERISKQAINCSQHMAGQEAIFEADHKSIYQLGHFQLRNKEWHKIDKPKCTYTPFFRENDQNVKMGEKGVEITSNTTLVDGPEFVQVFCKLPVFHDDYKDLFALIPIKESVEARVRKSPEDPDNQLSVIILGMDSVSQMNFIRQMPLSNEYLLKTLRAVPLKGYNKVGKNTLPNIVPLLTGLTLDQFKKKCVYEQEKDKVPAEIRLDSCPFIWKDFAARGFRTSFAEDQISIGIFHMYWPHAFQHPPTDYYLHTFTRQLEAHFGSGQCQGSRLSFKVLLDNVVNICKAFREPRRLHFQFSWSTRLSHDHAATLHLGDTHFRRSLEELENGGHLNRSVLLVVSDHGSRLGAVRATKQGPMEDRMPLAYIRVPPWFKIRYPQATRNLRKNSERLVSPFDIHETLKEFMDLSRLENSEIRRRFVSSRRRASKSRLQSSSLFLPLSANRTCFQAGIPLHWCLCYTQQRVSTTSPEVQSAAEFALKAMNEILKGKENACSSLQLDQVTDSFMWLNETIVAPPSFPSLEKINASQTENYVNSSVEHSNDNNSTGTAQELHLNSTPANALAFPLGIKLFGDIESDNDAPKELVQVTILWISFVTSPGDGTFEATLIRSSSDMGHSRERNKSVGWVLAEKIVRTNSYGEQSFCVDDHDLKEYCFCQQFDYFF